MKTLLISNQKGGVGKSALACQLAYYFNEKRKMRVLFVDLDHQANSSKSIAGSGFAKKSATVSSQTLTEKEVPIEDHEFVLISADQALLKKLERQLTSHNIFAGNFKTFLGSMADRFDICIIDTNPNPDIRSLSAMVSSDYVLSPIQLNQEAVDGIGALRADIRNVQTKLNPTLQFLGILPNMVVNTPFQKENMTDIAKHYFDLLVRLPNGRPAMIQTCTAIAEAQAEGKPIWKLPKTSARNAWRELEPTFAKLSDDMGVSANGP